MADDRIRECLFCWCTIIDPNFVVVDDFTIEILNIVMPKLGKDLDDSKEHLICNVCSWKLSTAFNFKSICLTTEDTLFPYLKREAPVDLRKIYMKEKGSSISDDQKICRLCLEPIDKEFVFAKELDVDFFQKCIPEMDLAATLDPVVCNKCVSNLIVHSSFIKRCFSTKKKLTNVYKQKVIGSRQYASSSDKSVSTDEEQDDSNTVKMETNTFRSDQTQNESAVKTEEVEIKDEVIRDSLPSIHYPVPSHGIHKLTRNQNGVQRKRSFSAKESVGDVELTLNADTKSCSCDHKMPNTKRVRLNINKCKVGSSLDCHKSNPCNCKRKPFSGDELLQNISKTRWYECNLCDYKSKHKFNLKTHGLQHKDSSEIEWYVCDVCGHKTKQKRLLESHMLVHKDFSEIQWYECRICSYKSKYKYHLKTHLVMHKDSSEIKWFLCDVCDYKSKRKTGLESHVLIHRHSSEIRWYECDLCSFKSKHVGNLKRHMLGHKDSSEIKWFVCDVCDYKSKDKSSLKKHLLMHRDSSEIQWYECDLCNFKSKQMGNLKRHMLRHKDSSDIKWFLCDICDFKSKEKSNLKQHMTVHNSSSKIQCYECNACNFQSKWKRGLKLHMLRHMDPSKTRWYQCKICSYKSKRVQNLKIHAKTHT